MARTISTRRRKPSKPPIDAELALEEWGPRGSTVADLDGRRVLVDRGIPGERVTASIDRTRKPWRGVVGLVLQPSMDRTAPPCPYYLTGCGGCQLQHVEYVAQLRIKEALLNREIAGAGVEKTVDRVWGMETPWRYRRTAAVAIGWEAGFRPRGRRGIIEIHDCSISHPLIGSLAHELNGLLDAAALPNYHGKVWLDCTVVGTDLSPALQVVIQGIAGLTLDSHPELPEVAATIARIGSVQSVAYRHRSGEVRTLLGELTCVIEVSGRPMHLPAGSFFQTNLHMLSTLQRRMREALVGRSVGSAADVYGGVGTLGLALADSVASMTIVELDPAAVEAARHTAADWGLSNVEYISRHAERALPEMHELDLAIVDPPRSGLGNVVIASLVENRVGLILYVSCAPQSLARDLAAFRDAGYAVGSLEIFDFYPQTYHVESLAVISR